MGISVLYLFVFAFASLFPRKRTYPKARKQHRYAVLYPAYKEDKVIEAATASFLTQTYPRELYDVIVLSDQMQDATNERLEAMGTQVIRVNFPESSKAKALQLAMNTLDATKYDAVIVMDGDNLVETDFLESVNRAFDAGCRAIQTHRLAKSRETKTAVLDAVSEEINNSFFRKGHVNLGIAASLIGSGMVFDYAWFKENVFAISTAGEDKELEGLLLKQRVFVEYLNEVKVLDEKISKDAAFYNQRRRWIASQYGALLKALPDLLPAIWQRNWGYVDKIFQWMMLPRSILIAGIGFLSVLTLVWDWQMSLKWWSLLIFLGITIFVAIPRYLYNKNLFLSVVKVPWLTLLMFLNFFRLRGVNKKFIHTEHG
jgi:cellulose synthase/poly-beta-1,6-N-acetylglucosamine synthase-like glycosyltransferase